MGETQVPAKFENVTHSRPKVDLKTCRKAKSPFVEMTLEHSNSVPRSIQRNRMLKAIIRTIYQLTKSEEYKASWEDWSW